MPLQRKKEMQKQHLAGIFLFLILILFSAAATADETLFFCVTSETSDRVHLRSGPSSETESLGLYFVGTPVILYPQTNKEWLQVSIGAETGYMYCDNLTPVKNAYDMPVQWKQASVQPSALDGWINLRAYPSKEAPVLEKKQKDESLLVLGETKSHWCYVRDGDVYGYIMSAYLDIGDTPLNSRIYCSNIHQPVNFCGDWLFASGVGAWSTQIHVFPDGSFLGYYHDWDASWEGDDSGLLSALYESLFSGRFSVAQKVSDWEYQVKVEYIQDLSCMEMYRFGDEMHIPVTPYGVTQNAHVSIYLPGAPEELLPKSYCEQMENYLAILNKRMGLYCLEHDAAWI